MSGLSTLIGVAVISLGVWQPVPPAMSEKGPTHSGVTQKSSFFPGPGAAFLFGVGLGLIARRSRSATDRATTR